MDDLGWHDTIDSLPKDEEVVLGEYRGEYFVVRYHRFGYGKPQSKEDCAHWESMCCRFPIRNVDKWKRIMSEWISVRDELPSREEYLGSLDVSKCVLICTTHKIISVAHLTNHLNNLNPMVWAKCNCDYLGLTLGEEEWAPNEVTHWMPLPKAPKEDK